MQELGHPSWAVPKISSPVVVISDLHLRDAGHCQADFFRHWVTALDRDVVREVILLGDILDFYFGPSPFHLEKFSFFFKTLEELVLDGVAVTYLAGNHEFHLERSPPAGVTLSQDATLLREVAGQTLVLTHGDRVAASSSYRAYRWVMDGAAVAGVAQLVPQRWLDRRALELASLSRQRHQGKRFPHRRVIGQLRRWACSFPEASGVIFGHFHVPYHFRADGKVFIGLPGYPSLGWLCLGAGGGERWVWQHSRRQWMCEKIIFAQGRR